MNKPTNQRVNKQMNEMTNNSHTRLFSSSTMNEWSCLDLHFVHFEKNTTTRGLRDNSDLVEVAPERCYDKGGGVSPSQHGRLCVQRWPCLAVGGQAFRILVHEFVSFIALMDGNS